VHSQLRGSLAGLQLSSSIPEQHRPDGAAYVGKGLDLRFLPKELNERSRQLIESYHGVHGYAKLADVLWHVEIREFIVLHDDLRSVFRKASIARSAKQANRGYVLVATVLLSLELLANDFAGWGKRFPLAKLRAESILRGHLPNARTWLTDFYLYQWRRTMDRAILSTISPPAANARPHGPNIDFSQRDQGALADHGHERSTGVGWK
jgi:hypothetical protein